MRAIGDLERSLKELAAEIDYPPEPNLARSVRARIEATPRRGAAAAAGGSLLPLRRLRPRWGTALVAAAVVLLTATVSLVALPGVRSAVADWLGLGGVRIETGGPTPAPIGDSLDLGEATSLEAVRARVDFDVVLPGALDGPDEVFFDDLVPGGQVALVYRERRSLPATPDSDIGALITQFQGSLDEPVVKKVISGEPGTTVVPVRVHGSSGYWISGEPHFISYLDANGQPREETVRLVGNVLLWEQDGVTLRIESALSKRGALAIAESMR